MNEFRKPLPVFSNVPVDYLQQPFIEKQNIRKKLRTRRLQFLSARRERASTVLTWDQRITQTAESSGLVGVVRKFGSAEYLHYEQPEPEIVPSDYDLLVIYNTDYIKKTAHNATDLGEMIGFSAGAIEATQKDIDDLVSGNIHFLRYSFQEKGLPFHVLFSTFQNMKTLFSPPKTLEDVRIERRKAIDTDESVKIWKNLDITGKAVYYYPPFIQIEIDENNAQADIEILSQGYIPSRRSFLIPHDWQYYEPGKNLYNSAEDEAVLLESHIWKYMTGLFLRFHNLVDEQGKPLPEAYNKKNRQLILTLSLRRKRFSTETKERLIERYLQELRVIETN